MVAVSIIIPVYNVAAYLPACIESVLAQTYRDLEIILVDDGSTDDCPAICDAYAAKDTRIRVIHKENGGLSSARNAGVQTANGEYVLLLDGDDYLREDAVERLLATAEEYPADLIQFRYVEVEGDTVPPIEHGNMEITQADSPAELFANLYRLGGIGASGCTKLYRRELLLAIPFEDIRHEDEMWCTRAFQTPLKVTYINDVLYFYVLRNSSIIRSNFRADKLDIFRVIDERLTALKKLGLSDLVSTEYSKLFGSILRLYKEAKDSGDTDSCRKIREVFLENRQDIAGYGRITGKFGIMLRLMQIRFGFIKLYCAYHNIKENRS